MPSYLVETYLPRARVQRAGFGRTAGTFGGRRADAASTRVRFDRSIHVPEDEICFFVFDAPSGRDAALAAERAELDPIRIVEAVEAIKEEL